MNLKIRDKVIAIMVVLIIIPIVLLGWSSYNTSSKALKRQYEDLGKIIGTEATVLLESKIENTNKLLEDLGDDPALKNIEENEESLESIIEKFQRTRDTYDFLDIYFGSTTGEIYIASGADTTGIDATERPWYIKASESRDIVWSEMYEDALTGNKAITVSRPLYDGEELLGVVGIDIDLDDFSKDILKVDIMGGHPIVMDSESTIIIDKIKPNIGTKFEASDLFKTDKKVQTKEYVYENKEANINQRQLIVFAPINGSDWKVATIIGMDALTKLNQRMLRNLLIIGLVTVLVAVLIAVAFGKNIANSINEVLNVIRKMESGDFTARIHTKNRDEFGELRDRFNNMMNTLGMFIGKIKSASTSVDEYSGNLAAISEQVSASSLEISTTAEEIARGASSQADDTEQGVMLINNLSCKLLDLDTTSASMVDLTEDIKTTSKESYEVVKDLKEKTMLNNESSERVGREIVELDKRIGGVTDILSTIDQISEQTNLLALNASIEAARAGVYGKGFAVVAEEIRKLAGESKESSNNIKNILEAVQNESKHTVLVVKEVGKRNEEQNEAVSRVSESFETIGELIGDIVEKIGEITEKSTDMNRDKEKIVSSIENISAISEETAAASEEVTASIQQQTSATEEVATSASKLNELANELNKEISVFKV